MTITTLPIWTYHRSKPKLVEELKAMKKLPAKRYDDYTKIDCKVRRFVSSRPTADQRQ